VRHIVIPGTGLEVSAICLGTASPGNTIDPQTSFALVDVCLAQGGNPLDTARICANGLPIKESSSEKTIGRGLKARGP
jgi:aryl-alcohol dehydrogenase-like predicted oxidoreductase